MVNLQCKATIRLESLDILRGLDLFLLVFFQPVFMALAAKLPSIPFLGIITEQFTHVYWEGFALWDLVMPLFMFMAGVSMPFSLNKYINENKNRAYQRVFKRFIILFLLGGIVQGNFLAFDPKHIYIYCNTLQAIATGYLITSLLYLHFKEIGIFAGIFVLFFIYLLSMSFLGDFTPEGNLAEKIDCMILGRFRDGVYWKEDGTWDFASYYHYTWIWSSLSFAVTVMLGFITGYIMYRFSYDRKKVVKNLYVFGLVLLIFGLLLSIYIPIIKTIWSSSMTLFSGGICILLMSLFYYIIDYKGWRKGFSWLKIYGMNSIVAYVLGETVNFRCIAHSFTYGLQQYMGDYYNIWLTFANFLILFFILKLMYKNKIFLKV